MSASWPWLAEPADGRRSTTIHCADPFSSAVIITGSVLYYSDNTTYSNLLLSIDVRRFDRRNQFRKLLPIHAHRTVSDKNRSSRYRAWSWHCRFTEPTKILVRLIFYFWMVERKPIRLYRRLLDNSLIIPCLGKFLTENPVNRLIKLHLHDSKFVRAISNCRKTSVQINTISPTNKFRPSSSGASGLEWHEQQFPGWS